VVRKKLRLPHRTGKFSAPLDDPPTHVVNA
jgi:hypothetical protein